jgi:protein-S-isoprenylcysteine O-methyltransferase Ste14
MIENKLNFFFKNQIWHIGGLLLLFYLSNQIIDFENNSNIFLGIGVKNWFLFSMMTPLLHQGYVWLCWRSELCWKTISTTIGFKAYAVIFIIIMILRLFSIGLCFADYGSWFNPGLIAWTISVLIFIPFIYTLYSIKKYFGFMRATGIDHFDPEYRSRPLVREGVFRWTSNAMYVFAIQSLWLFGILAASKLALVAAAFQAVYIWVHYYATEKPDMAFIYHKQQ